MKVNPEELKEIVKEILQGFKASEEEADLVAESLVLADMRGIDTHGVHFLTLLADRVDSGMIQIPTPLRIIKDEEATALIDGGNGLGQAAAFRAITMSIEKARRFGVGTVLVQNTNHIGILAFYTLQAAKQGMAGWVMSNAAPSMSPWGGVEPFFGTNPISIAVPGDGESPLLLDMSSSLVARGKIRRAERMKETIPMGWALDEHGESTTDPSAALKGTLAPMGGPKGYGLALLIDILSGLLSGSKFGPNVKTFHQPLGPTGIGVFAMAIDIEKFMPLPQFRSLMKSYLSSIKGSKRAKGVSRIYVPGEIEFERERKSRQEGIELTGSMISSLNQLLGKAGSLRRIKDAIV